MVEIHVVLYPKDTEKWKQFTTNFSFSCRHSRLCCIPKILKNESNSQPFCFLRWFQISCVVSQRYWKMKAIHNRLRFLLNNQQVVLYPKDTEKWKQFTTWPLVFVEIAMLCCIPKILKNESNSQPFQPVRYKKPSCVVSQRYWKMKAIHNSASDRVSSENVVLYPKDTEKWKQFTTYERFPTLINLLCCIPKILKNESNSQRFRPHASK